MNLEITKGGKLVKVKWEFDPSEQEGKYVRTDVTNKVPSLLFEHCTIEEGTTLRDVFLLIKKHLSFFVVVLNNWVEEFVEECFREREGDEDLDYIELYWHIEDDGDEVSGNTFPCLHAVGKDGKSWSISLSPIGKFANLPVKLSNELTIVTYSDTPNKHEVEVYDRPQFSLGQILHSIVWELSYYGPPSERDATLDIIMERIEDVKEMDTGS